MRKSWGGGKGIPCGGKLGGIGPPGPPPWGGGNGGKGMPRPGIGAVFFRTKGLVAEGQSCSGRERGFTREKSEGATLWWAALQAKGRWGET